MRRKPLLSTRRHRSLAGTSLQALWHHLTHQHMSYQLYLAMHRCQHTPLPWASSRSLLPGCRPRIPWPYLTFPVAQGLPHGWDPRIPWLYLCLPAPFLKTLPPRSNHHQGLLHRLRHLPALLAPFRHLPRQRFCHRLWSQAPRLTHQTFPLRLVLVALLAPFHYLRRLSSFPCLHLNTQASHRSTALKALSFPHPPALDRASPQVPLLRLQ